MSTFAEYVQGQYGKTIPFYDGSLDEARRTAQDQAMYLAIYFHCPTHEDAASFISDVLGDDEVIAHFAEHTILVGLSVMTEEGWRLALDLGVTTFPALVVTFRRSLVMRLLGPYTKAEFLHEWMASTAMWDGEVAEAVSYHYERNMREQERAREEAFISAMEQADIERLARIEEELREKRAAEQREQEQREKAEKAAAEAAAEARCQAEAAQREEARRAAEELERRKMTARLAEDAKARLPPAAPDDAPATETALVSVRSLSGKQHTHRFFRGDFVDAVLDFAVSVEDGCDSGELQLVTGFPPKALAWVRGQTKIGEMPMLCPRAVVIARKAS